VGTSSRLARDEKGFEEQKRDFARIVRVKDFLLVITADSAEPYTVDADDASPEQDDVIFKGFSEHLQHLMKEDTSMIDGLAERVIGCINATFAFEFVLKMQVPPQHTDPRYSLLVGKDGDVRVLWTEFIAQNSKAGNKHQKHTIKVLTANLNTERAKEDATSNGIPLEYAVDTRKGGSTKELVEKHLISAINKGVVDGDWSELLKSNS